MLARLVIFLIDKYKESRRYYLKTSNEIVKGMSHIKLYRD